MSKINRHPVRRTAAGVLASALVLSGAVAAAVPAQAAVGFELTRVAGDDRYETSALTVAAFGQATGAILASGENGRTPDALAASFLAGIRNQPVALTTRNRVTPEVLAALNGLGGKNVTIVGGTAAVSEDVVAQLRAAGFTVDRLFGANRYETAREIVEAGESAAASNVGLVASGTSTIDALAGGALSFAGKHPLFLVTRDGIPGATLEAMRASGVTSVYILGGEAVVSARVVAQLTAAGVTVRERLAGDNRSETSVAIANELIAEHGFSATTFNLASGLNEGVDALGAAALSGKERRVLLVTQNANTAPAVTGFATANVTRLTTAGRVFGGPAAISTTFEATVEQAAIGGTPTGPITIPTTSVVAGAAVSGTITGDFSQVTVSGCGFTNQVIGADSDNATAGRQFRLTLPAAQAAGACTLTFSATPTGGGAVVTQTVSITVTAPTSNQTFVITPADAATLTLVDDETGADATDDDRVYTVTNAVVGAVHQIRLANAENITVTNGVVSFEESGTSNRADFGTVTADITAVNGVPNTGGGQTARITPTASTFTFRVDGDADETVVPVVFFDADEDGFLDLQDSDAPVAAESFGIGGAINFQPTEAGQGAVTAAGVTELDEEDNQLIAGRLFNYDANDLFYIGTAATAANQVTLAQFEAQLSVGDALDADSTYQTSPELQSVFVLNDLAPAAPAIDEVAAETTDVSVTLTVTGADDADTVRVYGVVDPLTDTDGTPGDDVDADVTTRSTLLGSATTDQDADLDGFQVVLTGLTAATNYDIAATQVVDGEESELGAEIEVTTDDVADPVLITDARSVGDAPVVGRVGAGDQFAVAFDQDVAAGTLAATTFDLTDADGDLIRISSVAQADEDFLTSATYTLIDGGDAGTAVGDALRITLLETAEDRNAAGNAGTTGGGITLPLTITDVEGLETAAGDTVDVENSTDVSINVE